MAIVHTYYSLRYGAVSPADALHLLEDGAWQCGVIADINCTAGAIEFVRLAMKRNFAVRCGVDFRNGVSQQYTGIARNQRGFKELCSHLSLHLHDDLAFEKRAPHFEHALIIYPFREWRALYKNTLHAEISTLHDNEYVGVSIDDIPNLRLIKGIEKSDKIVWYQHFSFRNKRDFNAHRLLRAIDNNVLLSKLPQTQQARETERYLSRVEVKEALGEYAFLLERTERLLTECSIDFELGNTERNKNQRTFTGSEEKDFQLLCLLCDQGLGYRYPELRGKKLFCKEKNAIVERIEKELNLIREKRFVAYFLINWDITQYARNKGYFYVGRGSGANSVVAYLLRITDVDPIELDLYFERFINLFRQNPPDFDIDFSWKDRDDITQYIFTRFRNVTLLGSFVTFQYAAVVRELGKVFGLPGHEIDMLSDGKFSHDALDSMHRQVLFYSQYIQDFPNYISIHAAGILILEESAHCWGATFMPPKGFATTQFDMHQAEDIGISKFDILSQRGLSKIRDALDIISMNQVDAGYIDIHDIARFKKDEQCNALLKNAQAIGCFYVESPAMRMLLTKLQTHHYIGLVAASSVIRPGVSSSGMMRQYILRERQPERRKDAPEVLLDLMPETYGVMVYQEDVIKVAHYFAGLGLGEADVLRRGMSGKFRGREEFDKARIAFLEGAVKKGHSPDLAKEIWRQVESFAGYAFAKGHSASYAVESYQCLFLKAYYPLEYMVACINNYGGFYRTEIYVHEARMHGAKIESPCVNTSLNEALIIGKTIYIGFQFIKSLEQHTAALLLQARQAGPFLSLHDFLDRVAISLDQAIMLARIDAFRFTGFPKKEILWMLHLLMNKGKTQVHHPRLFATPSSNFILPALDHHWLEDAYDQLEIIGFPLCNPFDLIAETIENEIAARDFHLHIGKEIKTAGYLVTLKPTRTSKGEAMYFGTFLDRFGHFIDTVHFPSSAAQHRISGWGIFLIRGRVTEEFDAISIEVRDIRRLTLYPDPRIGDAPVHPAMLQQKNRHQSSTNLMKTKAHNKP